MHTAHMDRMDYGIRPKGTEIQLITMEVDTEAPPARRPDFVPGVMWALGTPPTIVPQANTTPKTAEFYDTHCRVGKVATPRHCQFDIMD